MFQWITIITAYNGVCIIYVLQVLLSRQKETRSYESWKCLSAPAAGGGIQNWSLGRDPMNRRMGEVVWSLCGFFYTSMPDCKMHKWNILYSRWSLGMHAHFRKGNPIPSLSVLFCQFNLLQLTSTYGMFADYWHPLTSGFYFQHLNSKLLEE